MERGQVLRAESWAGRGSHVRGVPGLGRLPGMNETAPLRFDELVVPTRDGERTVLVAVPTRKIRLGRDRLARMREGDRDSALDELILDTLRARDKRIDALLLCSWAGPGASWGFDEDLDQDELVALGYHLTRSQLKLFRRALVLGATAVCSTDLTPRDFDAVLEGWRRLSRELREKGELERNLKEDTDLFLLEYFTLWTTRPLQEFCDQALPSVFDLAQRYRERLDVLRARLTERERAMETP